jgi:pyruvate kinase
MKNHKAQIVATIGPASSKPEILRKMIEHQLGVVRMNFSWDTLDVRIQEIQLIRKLAKECGRQVPIIIDLPGPRIQDVSGHTYNRDAISAITEHDKQFIRFAAEHEVEYIAVSFVGGPEDILLCRKLIGSFSGAQKIIAKIERAIALKSLDEIIAAADAVMVARGDLGNEVPLEQIPFIQERIIHRSKAAGKPVITATQMLLSMVDHSVPTRAEVTDVANAILQGSDAVMLSEETTIGKYPIEVVEMMEKIVIEAEKHMANRNHINPL